VPYRRGKVGDRRVDTGGRREEVDYAVDKREDPRRPAVGADFAVSARRGGPVQRRRLIPRFPPRVGALGG
ncbi:MAG: hypothetical protein ACO2PM_08200, partial [Pyrobaculum sp.]